MNQVFQRQGASAAGEKRSEVFHRKSAVRSGGVDGRVEKKESAVGHGKISLFGPAVGARFFQSPNQSPQPTRLLGLRFPAARLRSAARCQSKKTACALPRAAEL